MGGTPFEPQHSLVGSQRQRLQSGLFFSEGLVDHSPRGGVDARIGNTIQPVAELAIKIIEIAEGATEKKVLPNIAERTLDFALRFLTIRAAGARLKAVMAGEIEKPPIIDDQALGIIADDGGLHAVVQYLTWRAADRLKSGDMTTQDALQILMDDEASP